MPGANCQGLMTKVQEWQKAGNKDFSGPCEGEDGEDPADACACFKAVHTLYKDDKTFAKDTAKCVLPAEMGLGTKELLGMFNACDGTTSLKEDGTEAKDDSSVFAFSMFVFGVFATLF